MDSVDNNQFEIVPDSKSKRKIAAPCPTAYLNPALDLLANEDPMVNTAMEIVPKKKKRTRSCDITAFENTALDLGISKAAVNEFLVRELENVRKNLRMESNVPDIVESAGACNNVSTQSSIEESLAGTDIQLSINKEEPIYANINVNLASTVVDKTVLDVDVIHPEIPSIDIEEEVEIIDTKERHQKDIKSSTNVFDTSLQAVNVVHEIFDTGNLSNITNIQNNVTNNVFVNNPTNLSLSFIDRLALDSPNVSNQSLYLDDDLNESNIMEIKTITIITKKKRIQIPDKKKITNPFLTNEPIEPLEVTQNPFINIANDTEIEYNPVDEVKPFDTQTNHENALMPRRLFSGDTNSTVSTFNESLNSGDSHEYENIDGLRSESPIYENIGEASGDNIYNKQSKILGCDVSRFSAIDIMNLNKMSTQVNLSNDSNNSKKEKHPFLNKLSRKVYKTLKKTFKTEKHIDNNISLNPYEVPRKPPKAKTNENEDTGIENPALNLDNSDEIEFEELDDEEHQYETIKTLRNTRLNMNVTPLKERNDDNSDISASTSKTATPGKKVRFDSTLNQEKVITGNSFNCDITSPGFDAKIDKFQDELENCINERKIIRQYM